MHLKQKIKAELDLLREVSEAEQIGFLENPLIDDDILYGFETDSIELNLPCLTEIKEDDASSGVHFRDCLVDYTQCSETRCIRKLV